VINNKKKGFYNIEAVSRSGWKGANI